MYLHALEPTRASSLIVHYFAESVKFLVQQHKISTAYHPESQGLVERLNQVIVKSLAAAGVWNRLTLSSITFIYNTTPVASLGIAPFQIMFGRSSNVPLEVDYESLKGTSPTQFAAILDDFSKIRQQVADKLHDSAIKQQSAVIRQYIEFQVDDKVWVYIFLQQVFIS